MLRGEATYKMRAVLCAALVAMAVGLASCAGGQAQEGESSSDAASANRAYMAQVNQQMADLDEVLEGFQAAVGSDDAVAMQAALVEAGRIVDKMKAAEAPSKLQDVKDGYVSGLEQLEQALSDYVQLYSDAQAGWLDEGTYGDRLAQVQAAYDAGVAAVADADAVAVAVANEPASGMAVSASSQSSASPEPAEAQDAQVQAAGADAPAGEEAN